jgi:hypothetical protein
MYSLSLDLQGFDALDAAIARLLAAADLTPLAQEFRQIMVDDNATRTLGGVDLNSVTLAPLQPFTLEHRKGAGPPLAPEGASAMLVTDYTVDVNVPDPNTVTIVGYWPNTPWVRFHETGYTHNRTGRFVPARNPVGITPEGQQKIADAFERFVTDTAAAFGATG